MLTFLHFRLNAKFNVRKIYSKFTFNTVQLVLKILEIHFIVIMVDFK